MIVQDFLKRHGNDGLEKLKENFKIEVREYDDRVVLNYSQIDSDKYEPICKECRALILRKNTWEVLARSFDRFFNVGECLEDKDFPIDKCRIDQKLDGCCDAETKIMTKLGDKTIKEICDSKLSVEILGFDETTGEKKWTKIENYSIKQNNNDWYELTTKNHKIIKLTGNHRVYLPEYHCYRKVNELKEGDIVLALE
jgi:hypothetical protein